MSTSPAKQSLVATLRQPAFIVCCLILLVSAAGLNGAVQYLKLSFQKKSVPLRVQSLEIIPSRLGPFMQVSVDRPLVPEIQEVLGTDKYIFREYVDTRRLSASELEELTGASIDDRPRIAAKLRVQSSDRFVHVAVTYYTGLVDTVAHIPDRCYIADGYDVVPGSYQTLSWGALAGKPGDNTVRYISFEDATPGRGAIQRNVAYFFHTNGQYEGSPLGVRKRLANLFETHGYYAKIELMTLMRDRDDSAQLMNNVLEHLLPEVEKCLPDWEKLQRDLAANKDRRGG
jgi:hypothetical protein